MEDLGERLAEIERLGLARRTQVVGGPQGPRVLLDGRPVLLLCSNNYLGLAEHPKVRQAAAQAAMTLGAGAGASRLVSGTMAIHGQLEERLARFARSEACVLFGAGYLANMGVIGAFAGPGDTIFSDALNHASIIDGCRASRARVVVYRHCDVEHLRQLLRTEGGRGRRLVVTDAVFSMDGDLAPLPEIVALAREHDARLLVDEAHATGALGPGGRGAVAHFGLEGQIDAIVGTLGKALGSYGAYVCGSHQTIDYLVNVARTLIFSTAPPPPTVAAALAGLQLLEEQPKLVDRLRGAARVLRGALAAEGFAVRQGEMHIVPLIVGDEQTTMRLSRMALEEGVYAQGIRPPTVPLGSGRLRLTAMASHEPGDLRAAAATLGRAARAIGLDPAKSSPGPAAGRVGSGWLTGSRRLAVAL